MKNLRGSEYFPYPLYIHIYETYKKKNFNYSPITLDFSFKGTVHLKIYIYFFFHKQKQSRRVLRVPVDFDLRGEQGINFLTGGRILWIVDAFDQKQQFKVKMA